jgi:hypothetical protein
MRLAGKIALVTGAARGIGARRVGGDAEAEGSSSFLKKRTKKLLLIGTRGPGAKVFWFFFSKKNCFLPY